MSDKVVDLHPARGPDGKWHDDIQCFVVTMGYHYEARFGMLLVDRNSSTNMSGVIRMFTAIDPGVERVMVFCGPNADIEYVQADGIWRAESRR